MPQSSGACSDINLRRQVSLEAFPIFNYFAIDCCERCFLSFVIELERWTNARRSLNLVQVEQISFPAV
jgi:hypothetical protein